jgi:hypothetical protein
MEFLWYVVSAPGRLMPILWPVLVGMPLFMATLTSVTRVLVLRRVERASVHPAMRAGPRWALTVALGTFLATWAFVAAAVAVALLVTGASGMTPPRA